MKITTDIPHFNSLIDLVKAAAEEITIEGLDLIMKINLEMDNKNKHQPLLSFKVNFSMLTDAPSSVHEDLNAFMGNEVIVHGEVIDDQFKVFFCNEEDQSDTICHDFRLDGLTEEIIDWIFAVSKRALIR